VSVILTTRLSDAGKYASLDPHDVSANLFLRLDGLDAEAAIDLILKASEVRERDVKSTQQARHIADVLDHHPLALVIASSLIQSTTYSLEEYAEALTTRFAQSELLNTESEQATYRKVSATFEVSADTLMSLAKTDSSAQNALALLDILGFLHHQGVPEDIFVRAWESADVVSSRSKDKDWPSEDLTSWHVARSRYFPVHGTTEEKKRAFRRCRAHLIKLSLVSIDTTKRVMSLHSLVHTWARARAQHPIEAWTAAASILSLSTQDYREWRAFTPWLAKHLEACFTFQQSYSVTTSSSLDICRIWHAFAWQMECAHSPGATELCQRIVGELSGREDSEYLLVSSQHLLGILYRHNGQTLRAVELLEYVMKVREKLADDHPSRLASQHELAAAYRANGQVLRAIELLEHVVKVQEQLADDHPDRLASQHGLARAYRANGQVLRAIELLEHVVKVREQLADDHPSRLVYQHDLAISYWDNGQGIEAKCLLREVVAIQQKSLRADHPYRVSAERWLADIVQGNKRTPEPSPDVSTGAEQVLEDSSPLSTRDNVVYRRVAISRKRKLKSLETSLLEKRSRVSDDR
jgi:tetratricopeptide (TPR) repeat protein